MNTATQIAKKKLALALEITGMSMNALSKQIGVADTTLSRLKKLDNPPEPRASTIERIDKAVTDYIASGQATEKQIDLFRTEYEQFLNMDGAESIPTTVTEAFAALARAAKGETPRLQHANSPADLIAAEDQYHAVPADRIPAFLRRESAPPRTTRKKSSRDILADFVKQHPTPPVEHRTDIPVYGTAAGSLVGSMQVEEGRQVSYVERPRGLRSSARAYALIVTGSSMSPQFKEGDLVFVDPDRKINAGDTIIIQTQNFNKEYDEPTRAYIKTFRGVMDNVLYTEQLNPPAKLDFPMKGKQEGAELVYSYDRVLTTRELFDV